MAILYFLVVGCVELIMFGGLQKDVAMMRNQAAANENDSVANRDEWIPLFSDIRILGYLGY